MTDDDAPTNARAQARVKPAYAIFEGGGAKGITHIGALKALEKNGYAIVGAAGASAGAIIAALTAVGYSADELLDPMAGTDLLSNYEMKPTDLLGRRPWAFFNALRLITPWTLAGAGALSVIRFLINVTGALANYSNLITFFALVLIVPGALLLVPVIFCRGYLSTREIRKTLNFILRERLKAHYVDLGFDHEPPRYIRFSHIDPTVIPQCSLLKVIVSDANNNCLVQFDQNTPDVIVADAVAASAAIPFVFRSPPVRGAATDSDPVYVDGGLISNLPVWAFSSEKRALEREQQGAPIPVFAFTLSAKLNTPSAQGESQPSGRSSNRIVRFFHSLWKLIYYLPSKVFRPFSLFFRHVGLIVQTGIFGSQAIVKDFIPDLTVLQLRSPLKTLDFGCSREGAVSAYHAGFEQANNEISEALLVDELINSLLADLLERIIVRLQQIRSDLNVRDVSAKASNYSIFYKKTKQFTPESPPFPRLRLYLLIKLRGGSFKVFQSSGMDADSDDRMEFDARSKLGPRVFSERQATYTEFWGNARDPWMTKYEGALVSRDRQSIIAIPVFANPAARDIYGAKAPVQKALCLDSSDKLQSEFNDPEFLDWLSTEAVVFAQLMLKDLIDG